jgi:predicted small lipoprotein YifL
MILTHSLSRLCLIIYILGIMLLAGCGQKGDLYLPDETAKQGENTQPNAEQSESTPTTTEQQKDKKKSEQ